MPRDTLKGKYWREQLHNELNISRFTLSTAEWVRAWANFEEGWVQGPVMKNSHVNFPKAFFLHL